MPTKLSKQAKQKLFHTLEEIADLTIDANKAPNEAIAKVATENKIPSGHIQLLVNAYNTSKSAAQRQASDNIWEKAGEFELANTDKILKLMYPDKEDLSKTASVNLINGKEPTSIDYELPPTWVNKVNSDCMFKQAQLGPMPAMQDDDDESEELDINAGDLDDQKPDFNKVINKLNKMKTAVENVRFKTAAAFDLGVELADDLLHSFKLVNGHQPFCAVRDNSILLFGKKAEALFKSLSEKDPSLLKQASTGAEDTSDPIYIKVSTCLKAADMYSDALDYYTEKSAEYIAEETKLLAPFQPVDYISTNLSTLITKYAAGFKPEKDKSEGSDKGGKGNKGFLNTFITGPLSSVVNPISDSIANLTSRKLVDGDSKKKLFQGINERIMGSRQPVLFKDHKPNVVNKYDSQLSKIQATANLSELMGNDEVLSEADPHQVLQAYKEIRNLAPTAASRLETLRTLLRERIQSGAQSIFQLNEALKSEKLLRETSAPSGLIRLNKNDNEEEEETKK